MKRCSQVERKTKETRISIRLNLDGSGEAKIAVFPVFFSHMLEAFACHGLFDLSLVAEGDLHVDQHHLLEDTGFVLGEAFSKALGERKGIYRSGFYLFPMEDALSAVAVDLSGRPYCKCEASFKRRFVGEMDTDCLEDFIYGLSVGLRGTVNVTMYQGRSDHHKMESIFKALGKSLRMACTRDNRLGDRFPSTKEVMDNGGDY
ncbi:MAG TPA: imidazoleglycerol-phosphate dehydratase [Candidatus Mcinerneyibacteriales bacterium]|nr:imidazoleglycerol-phosphate dehydratase [Candidatus Mcinerneyibacteriales bacterium]